MIGFYTDSENIVMATNTSVTLVQSIVAINFTALIKLSSAKLFIPAIEWIANNVQPRATSGGSGQSNSETIIEATLTVNEPPPPSTSSK